MRRELEDLVPYCPKCGYNLTGLKEHRCPECGSPFDPVELLKRQLLPPQASIPKLIIPNLIVAPIFVSGVIVFIGVSYISNLAGLAVILLLFGFYMVRNGRKIQRLIAQMHHSSQAGESRLRDLLVRGGITTYLLLQVIPVAIFWGGIIWFLIRNPPRFFGL